MNGEAEGFLTPDHCFGVERLTDACDEAEARKIEIFDHIDPDLHHHANGSGGCVPDAHSLVLNDSVPALGIELRFVDHIGNAV